MQKHARIHGSTLRARPLEQKAAAARLVEKEVLPGFEAGLLTVPVAETFELDRVEDAYDALRGRRQARQDRAPALGLEAADVCPIGICPMGTAPCPVDNCCRPKRQTRREAGAQSQRPLHGR